MPSGLRPRLAAPPARPAGRAAEGRARTEAHLGEVLRECSFEQLLSDPAEEAERIDPHGTRVIDVGDGPLSRPARQHDVRRTCRTQRGDEVGAPLGVRRVGAGQADDRLAGVGRDDRLDPVGRAGRRRRRPRRRRTGWWRRWRARCGRRSGPSWRGRPAGPAGSSRMLLEGAAVVAHPSGAPGRPLGQRLGEVRELARSRSAGATGRRCRRRAPRGPRATRSLTPAAACSPNPPSASIRPSSAQPATARSSVSLSTAYDPPAGSDTAATWASSIEERGGVAGDPAAEGVGRPSALVERHHGDGVGAADARSEGRDGGAEHVDPGVVLAHHRRGW